MKKLMLAAATAAIAAGIFAAPTVYDYKAAVKHLYLKETPVTYEKQKIWIYTKYQKSTSLTGYLIMDQDGYTSPTIITNDLTSTVYYTPSTGFDYGRNRGFLVVQNNSANAIVRHPKILPAVLDAKWMDTAFAKLGKATSGPAEGYLYVGGDAVEPVRPQLDAIYDADLDDWYSEQRAEVPTVPSSAVSAGSTGDTSKTVYPGMVAVADYLWTSVYLFAGSTTKDAYYNGPNWFVRSKVYSPFGHFEYLWDQNLPELLRTGWEKVTEGEGDDAIVLGYKKSPVNYYHDTWMNGSGVGKWSKGKVTSEACCGIVDLLGSDDRVLETLSGNLKGGLFLCTENGIVVGSNNYLWFSVDPDDMLEWEDQFNTARLHNWADLFEGDVWQNDLWQDGFLEVETTDVIWGTWSIKINTKFYAEKGIFDTYGNITAKDVSNLQAKSIETLLTPAETPTGAKENTLTVMWDETLLGTIKAAALKLNPKGATWFDGSEIYSKSSKTRYELPMLTPKFAIYYRLLWAEYDKAN